MLSLAYTISPELQNELVACTYLRQQALLKVLSPKTELKLRWQSQVNRIADLLSILGFTAAKNEIIPFLFASSPVKSLPGLTIVSLHRLLNYLWLNWTASEKTLKVGELEEMLESTVEIRLRKPLQNLINSHYQALSRLLTYLQAQAEQPPITAGLAQIEIPALCGSGDFSIFLGRIVAYLFLFKGGYDLRNLLYLGKGKAEDLARLKGEINATEAKGNATSFLLWFSLQLKNQLSSLTEDIRVVPSPGPKTDPFASLNHRQEEILFLLENPQAKITNRDVQRRFKISQITASRDLAKLATLNLIFAHGKGRSIFYTKI